MIPLILRSQLDAMCEIAEQVDDWSDPKSVHDARVASRRLRSSISNFKPYLSKPGLTRLKLNAMARNLGVLRDEDVALEALQDLKEKASGAAAKGIDLTIKERQGWREEALRKAIKPEALDGIREELLEKLDDVDFEDTSKTLGEVAAEVIEKRVKDFLSASPHIYQPLESKELHELRILAKRLRYAAELFAPCWPEADFKAIAKEISQLQDSLGEVHDCDVWIEDLGTRLQDSRKDWDPVAAERAHAGATWLLEHFSRQRGEHYHEALSLWEEWQANNFFEQLRKNVSGF